MEKIKLRVPVLVEGKYDKIKVSSVVDAPVITTEGFGVFRDRERLSLIRRLSEDGIVVLTDSDGAGKVIRSFISSAVPPEKIYNLYTPRVQGREKRKKEPSAEGVLGVEGTDTETLIAIFTDFVARHPEAAKRVSVATGDPDGAGGTDKTEARGGEAVTKTDFFVCGLTGDEKSRQKRDALAKKLRLPPDMTPNALLAAVNMLLTKEEFYRLAKDGAYGKE